MNIDTLEPVAIGGITQWVRIRGTSASNVTTIRSQSVSSVVRARM